MAAMARFLWCGGNRRRDFDRFGGAIDWMIGLVPTTTALNALGDKVGDNGGGGRHLLVDAHG